MELSEKEKKEILAIIRKKDGSFRISKPKVSRDIPITGRAAYVWRHVRFIVGNRRADHCLPMTADFNLCKADWNNRKEVIGALDKLVDEIVNEIPKSQWHGIARWSGLI